MSYPLFNFLKERISLDLSSHLIWKLAKELASENEFKVKMFGAYKFYYSDAIVLDQLIEKKNKKKINRFNPKIKEEISNFTDEFNHLHKLSFQEELTLKASLREVTKLLLHQNLRDQNLIVYPYREFILVINELVIKKNIHLLLEQKKGFESLKPWLTLHEINLKDNSKIFRGQKFKKYQKIMNRILLLSDFCSKDNRNKIMCTPDYLLRLKYFLCYFDIKKELADSMFSFIKNIISRGYVIDSKNLRGVLAGVFYIYTLKFKIHVTQKWIATVFKTNVVTLRIRRNELNIYSDLIKNLELKEIILKQIKGKNKLITNKNYMNKVLTLINKHVKVRINYYKDLIETYYLVRELQEHLKIVLFRIEAYILSIDQKYRDSKETMCVFSQFVIKKEIYSLLRKNVTRELLKPWLILNEIFLCEIHNKFQANREKTYQYLKNIILNDSTFCEAKERIQILNTPSSPLRKKFLLRYLGVNKELTDLISKFIEMCVSKGYYISDEDLNSVLAGAFSIFSEIYDLAMTQNRIASKFEVSELKLLEKKRELTTYLHKFSFPISNL